MPSSHVAAGGNRTIRTRHRIIAIAAGLTAALSLAACSNGVQPTGAPPAGETVTVTSWDAFTPEGQVAALEQTFTDFHQANPSIEIARTLIAGDVPQKILQGAAAGTLPDIIITDPNAGSFAAQGIAADITDMVKEWGGIGQYSKGAQEYVMYDGKYYGVPYQNNNLALYYNKKMLADANITPPTTWEELRSAAEKLTKDGVYGLAIAANPGGEGIFQFFPILWQSGADLDTLDSPEGVAAVDFWSSFVTDGLASADSVNWGMQDTIEQLINGRAAMVVNGPWNLPTVRAADGFDWGLTQLPRGKEQATVLGGEIFMISAQSKHPKEAFEYLKFVQQPDVLDKMWQGTGSIPTIPEIAERSHWQQDEAIQVFAQSMEFARARNYGEKYPQIVAAMDEMVQSTMLGTATAAQAVPQAAAKIAPLLP